MNDILNVFVAENRKFIDIVNIAQKNNGDFGPASKFCKKKYEYILHFYISIFFSM